MKKQGAPLSVSSGLSTVASRYEVIWNRIKRDAPKAVKIRCRPKKIPTIVLAVKKIKSAENRGRISLDLGRYGKMQIGREVVNDALAFISFKLLSAERAENL